MDEKSRIVKPNGTFPRGIGRNKLAVELAIDIHGDTYGMVMGRGHPTARQILSALRGHIAPGSLVIYDDLRGYRDAMAALGVRELIAKNGRLGSMKAMQPINSLCALVWGGGLPACRGEGQEPAALRRLGVPPDEAQVDTAEGPKDDDPGDAFRKEVPPLEPETTL